MGLKDLTPEQRQQALAAAHAATAALRASAGELKHDWADAEVWADLARDRGLRLPPQYLRPTPPMIRRWCRKLGLSAREFCEWGGYTHLEDFARLNPRWPLYALVGVLLEYADERDEARAKLLSALSPNSNSA